MAFLLHSTSDGRVPPNEYLPAEAGTYVVGECVAIDTAGSHQLDTSVQPTHICVQNVTIANAGDPLAVIKIEDDMIFESQKDSTNAMTIGTTYDVATGGLLVDDNGSTYDNLECVWVEGAAQYDKVLVRFI